MTDVIKSDRLSLMEATRESKKLFDYEIYPDGRIKKGDKDIKQYLGGRKRDRRFHFVTLVFNKKPSRMAVHTLIYRVFSNNADYNSSRHVVIHKNGNTSDNSIDNLTIIAR